jgi:hypothetical protein
MWDMFAFFEVDRVELGAAAAPDRRRPAEEAEPRILEGVIILADILARIEIRNRGFVVEAATFEQDHLVPRRKQTAGKADPGRARADDADLPVENALTAQYSEVDQKSRPSMSAESAPLSTARFAQARSSAR